MHKGRGLATLLVLLQVHRWNCEACGVGYELGSIESALVAVVQQQERAYQLQDLHCIKCKNVRTDININLVSPNCCWHHHFPVMLWHPYAPAMLGKLCVCVCVCVQVKLTHHC